MSNKSNYVFWVAEKVRFKSKIKTIMSDTLEVNQVNRMDDEEKLEQEKAEKNKSLLQSK